jgi:hypothetical protein
MADAGAGCSACWQYGMTAASAPLAASQRTIHAITMRESLMFLPA